MKNYLACNELKQQLTAWGDQELFLHVQCFVASSRLNCTGVGWLSGFDCIGCSGLFNSTVRQ